MSSTRLNTNLDIFNIIQKVQDTVIHLKVDNEEQMADHTRKFCLKKNQNAPRPSEHPPVKGKNVKRSGEIIGCKYKTSSWHLNGFPYYGSNIGSTV